MPFTFPDSISFEDLMRSSPERDRRLESIRRIDLLYAGGSLLRQNAGLFIKQRLGEDRQDYAKRLDRVVYDPTFGDEVQNFCDRLFSGKISFGQGEIPEVYQAWLDNVDGCGLSFEEWLGAIFKLYLRHGLLWCFADTNRLPDEILAQVTNQLQAELLDRSARLLTLDLWSVLKWDSDGDRVRWLQYYSVDDSYDPMRPGEEPKRVATWTWVDEKQIAVYRANVLCDKHGLPISLDADPTLNEGRVSRIDLVNHGRDDTPVLQLGVRDPVQWVGDQVSMLAEMSFDLGSSSYDTAASAGYVARTWEPPSQTESLDTVSTEPPERSGWAVGKAEFVEFQGTSVRTVDEKVSKAEERIRQIITNVGVASASTAAMEQSGLSKQVDDDRSQLALLGYGETLLAYVQRCLNAIAEILGGSLQASGLDKFDLANGDRLLARIKEMNDASVRDRIPNTLHRVVVQELSQAIANTVDDETRNQIEAELKEIYSGEEQLVEPPNVVPIAS